MVNIQDKGIITMITNKMLHIYSLSLFRMLFCCTCRSSCCVMLKRKIHANVLMKEKRSHVVVLSFSRKWGNTVQKSLRSTGNASTIQAMTWASDSKQCFVFYYYAKLCIDKMHRSLLSTGVRLSVCPSCWCIVSKRLNLSDFFHHLVAPSF